MNSHTATPAQSYNTPWTLRAYDALPGNPLWIGIGFAAGLILLFFIGRYLFEGASRSTTDDLRVAVIHILLTAYNASAYAYLLMSARKTTQDLSTVAEDSRQWQTIVDRVGKYPRGLLPLLGAASYLILGVVTTNVTTPAAENPWDWQSWNYDVYWHRATTVFFVWWLGCLCYTIVRESARLSDLSDNLTSPDLLDLLPYQPLIRQGLTNALLVVGVVSIMSLFMVESRYGPVLVGSWVTFIVLAWTGLMLPLRGIRRKISIAKDQELDWCRQTMKIVRDELRSGSDVRLSIAEITAYREVIEDIRNWPFDNSTLVRFTLYIMIPLGSWTGGAIVERGIDSLLS